ncbi:MAG: LytTR family DNA-binding domain-containing protein [Cyclobacteriaceae bacterium]
MAIKYTCLIVEDEPLAAEVIKDYIDQVPFLEFKGICTDALFALEKLKNEQIDLMFLDIHLPKLKGFDFLRTLQKPPKVIITTAYHQYALDGYELDVLDYLMKPIDFSRFLKAVNKMITVTKTDVHLKNEKSDYIIISVKKMKVKVWIDDVVYVEGFKEYVKIFTDDNCFQPKMSLTRIEQLLPQNRFLRIHRSFIVAKDRLEAFNTTDVVVGGKQIPIGRSYKDLVMGQLG